MKNNIIYSISFFAIIIALNSCNQKEHSKTITTDPILSEVEIELENLTNVWYPKSIDTVNGGFWSDFNYKWDKEGAQNKMIVSQARHIWTTSVLAEHYKDKKYEKIAKHGYHFLRDKMWDSINGGFHTLVGFVGDGLKVISKNKSTYGNAFAIYGLATYYKVSDDTAALDLAKKTFSWIEEHAHDSIYKGYFDVLQQDGSWMLDITEDKGYDNFKRKDWKDQNSSIHLLECLSALYEVWPNDLVRERLEELLILIRDTITTEKGYLTLHLHRDWSPVTFKDSSAIYQKQNFGLDHVSFGHDVETAFLMLEASHILGRKKDTLTELKAKQMVDHGIAKGWDNKEGGFYDGGFYYTQDTCTVVKEAKVWWTEAEGLNSLLLMSKLYPNNPEYYNLFQKQWQYIKKNMIDHKYHGWYAEGMDTDSQADKKVKAQIWKVNYHNIRSLINVTQMLKGEFILTKELH
ncbi:AGE family epimerase/isomerase [Aurantibacter sp.]|uniref:AGE family epimerase/isomerase n=1 Tax=Aurantibacter sp. TaxID=2807103 RepID=UPI003267851A